ncbi:CBS domain-containing protein [Longimicrobium sp.]|jgi:predicted transcriptional regulator|uniref:CBS domain-containing protein n=1 Tax=Longimicrobium sp. TaxID=2029185 RepID=UPI002ED8CFCB
MTSDPLVTVRPGAGADDMMKKMRSSKVRRVMVTDGDGILRSVVAQADIVHEIRGGSSPTSGEDARRDLVAGGAGPVACFG